LFTILVFSGDQRPRAIRAVANEAGILCAWAGTQPFERGRVCGIQPLVELHVLLAGVPARPPVRLVVWRNQRVAIQQVTARNVVDRERVSICRLALAVARATDR